jgi:hypothetical protein
LFDLPAVFDRPAVLVDFLDGRQGRLAVEVGVGDLASPSATSAAG